jgi:hypothetical protein
MGKFYTQIPDDEKLIDWVRTQQLFHVATAPLHGTSTPSQSEHTHLHFVSAGGHVNVSPKGLPTFKLVNRKACWYLDLTGSGIHARVAARKVAQLTHVRRK